MREAKANMLIQCFLDNEPSKAICIRSKVSSLGRREEEEKVLYSGLYLHCLSGMIFGLSTLFFCVYCARNLQAKHWKKAIGQPLTLLLDGKNDYDLCLRHTMSCFLFERFSGNIVVVLTWELAPGIVLLGGS